MKIYTKTGDKGSTSLFDGKRVLKNHLRVECYGILDHLNVLIGKIKVLNQNVFDEKILNQLQNRIFIISSELATENIEKLPTSFTLTSEKDILFLESQIDLMSEKLPALTNFVLPGGNALSITCHEARVICRSAERVLVELMDEFDVSNLDSVMKYLNRFSDLCFVMARKACVDLNDSELLWKT